MFESFDKKLFGYSDSSLEQFRDARKVYTRLQQIFNEYEAFIGLSVCGSIPIGYGNDLSDLDICVYGNNDEVDVSDLYHEIISTYTRENKGGKNINLMFQPLTT